MLMRVRFLPALAVAIAVVCTMPICALSSEDLSYQWTDDDFAPLGNGEHWVYKKHNVDDFEDQVPYDWVHEVGNPQIVYDQSGIANVDPIVNQTMRNFTSDAWTDWHVSITNGYVYTDSAYVYNVNVPDPQWVVEYEGVYDGNKATGFLAHIVTGMDVQVDPFEQLLVHFVYDAIDSGEQVIISQNPTKDWPIPEPGSMAALLTGLAGVAGFAWRRKI